MINADSSNQISSRAFLNQTTNGVAAFRNLIAQEDSPSIANLRRAGAIVIGRTNAPEFSWRWFTDNELHGETFL